jgi:hypothetical protein
MSQRMNRSDEYWNNIEMIVTSKVRSAFKRGTVSQASLITYLRNLEEMARAECDRRQTIQIIASARSVLGDRKKIGLDDGPFVHNGGL